MTWDSNWIYPMAISPNGDLMAHNQVKFSEAGIDTSKFGGSIQTLMI